MAVSATLTLPGQPPAGVSTFSPLGGAGLSSPIACYLSSVAVVGDASSGNATCTINMDPRYCNLVAFVNVDVSSAAGAGDFQIRMESITAGPGPTVNILGTLPQTSAFISPNASFLWYPPPIYWVQEGTLRFTTPNVDVTETYTMVAQIYCFHPEATRRTPLGILQMNVPGVSAPAAV